MLARLRPPLRIPRAVLDPIASPLDALGVITLALGRPLSRQLIVIACDDARRGLSITRFIVDGDSPSHMGDALDRMIGYCSQVASSANVIVGVSEPLAASATQRLIDCTMASERCHRAGIALREWLVVTHGGVSSALG